MPIDKTFGRTEVQELISLVRTLAPQYDALSNAPADPGSLVYITGAGSDASGVYAYDGGWVGPLGSGSSDSTYTDEQAQDAVAAALTGGAEMSVSYDDANNTITLDFAGSHYTDEQAQDATGSMATEGLAYDDANNALSVNVVASGTTTLASNSAAVDTGVPVDDMHYMVPISPRGGADIAMSLEDDTAGSGNYILHLEENNTNIGNPTVGWKLVRV